MPQDFISVKDASERFGYSGSHIRQLLLANKMEGQKFANAWMVDTTSLAQYEARMERLGKRKHGLWANTSTVERAASEGAADDSTGVRQPRP